MALERWSESPEGFRAMVGARWAGSEPQLQLGSGWAGVQGGCKGPRKGAESEVCHCLNARTRRQTYCKE